tara:strand:- start:90 stop:602 length:513 start_codon:yes stop_codon:yes gene_type:complete
MKTQILLILSIILFISCQTKTVEVEVNSTAGKHFLTNFEGKKYIFGSDEDAKNAAALVLAFADKDSETMAKFMGDTVVYYPPQGARAMKTPKSAIHEVVKALHEPYDSLQRKLNNVIPLKIEGSDYTRVSVSFRENRYYKDGTQESVRLIDRIFFREGEIFRIIQWMGER